MKNKVRINVSGVISDENRFILPWSGRGINYNDEDINLVIKAMREADPLTQGSYQEEFE